MSYLLEFVQSFTEEEARLFRQLDLSGNYEVIRDLYANQVAEKNFKEAALPAKLGLTQSHFDKITSVVLNRALQHIYGDKLQTTLQALMHKGMSALMLHKLKISEREILKDAGKQQLIDFYKAAFENVCNMFHPHYDPKLARSYGNKYLQALGKLKSIADEFFVAMKIHCSDMLANSVAGNEYGFNTHAWGTLKKWEQRLKETKNPLAHFHYYFALGNCIKYYGTSAEDFIAANLKCLELLPKLNEEMQEANTFRLNCEVGFGLIEAGKYAKAEEYYARAFDSPFSARHIRGYPSGSYLNVCLINGHYTKAQKIYKAHLQKHLNPGVNRSMQFDVLVNAFCLFMHTSNFNEAYNILQRIRAYKRNEITPLGLVLLRLCEALYFYKTGNYPVTLNLAQKNIRFLKLSQYNNPQFNYYRNFFGYLLQISRVKNRGQVIPESMLEQRKQLHGGMYEVFNTLL
ncbi:MAG: hypothetical protein U0V74_15415 [Chitinophagales bacterium]